MKPELKAKLDELLEAARGVDPQNERARSRFILWAMSRELWVRGKTAGPLAKLWKMSKHTVDRDASLAFRVVKTAESSDELGRAAVQASLSLLEERADLTAKAARRLAQEYDAGGKPSAIRDLSAALTGLDSTVVRTAEWLGKVSGKTNDTPMVQVVIGGQPTKVRPEMLASMPTQLFEMLERVVDAHPEHAAVLPLLAAEIRRSFGSNEAVVVEQGIKKLE